MIWSWQKVESFIGQPKVKYKPTLHQVVTLSLVLFSEFPWSHIF
jgi:hypothetical protein